MSNSQGGVALLRETLLETLANISSSDEKKKEKALKKNQELEFLLTNEFGIQLIECVFDADNAVEVRQSASQTLEHFVKRHWCSSFETFQPPEIELETKTKFKELSLPGHAIADTISAIARSDWSNNWPELFDTLVEYLRGNSSTQSSAYGALRVFTALTKELTDVQLPTFGPAILREVYAILKDDAEPSKLRCGIATNIFTEMITNVTKYERFDLIQQCLEPSIGTFCAQFLEELRPEEEENREENQETDEGEEEEDEDEVVGEETLELEIHDYRFRFRIIETIGLLTKKLPKCISTFLPQMLPLIWEILKECAKVYHETNANLREGRLPRTFYDLVLAVMDLISALMRGGTDECLVCLPEYNLLDYHWFYLQDSIPPEVLHHLTTFIGINDAQINLWTNNLNQYITDEKLTANSQQSRSIRRAAKELLLKIVRRPERAAANALCDVLLKQIEEGNTMRASNESSTRQNWWKLHEASIEVFGIMKDIIVEKQKSETLNFDVAAFLKNVVLQDFEDSDAHALLLGSCLYIGGLYSQEMPPELSSKFIECTLNGLKNKPACVRICAAKASTLWLRSVSTEGNNNNKNENFLRSQLPVLFRELFNLGNQSMSVEVLRIVLENFATLTTFDTAFTASVESSICTLTITASFNFRSNSSICKVCQEIFSELTKNPECIEPLHTRLVPMLVAKLTVGSTEKSNDGSYDLDVLQVLVQHSPQPLNSFLMDSAFPTACRFILSSSNYLVLLSGAKVMRTYLSVAAQLVLGYKDNDGKTGPQYISKVAAHLLKSHFAELLIDDICEIMTTLITAGNTLEENLNGLLKAILTEMMKCTGARPCVRKLLMVYARLLNTEFDAVLEFLSTAQGPNEQSALAFVLSDGFCKEHESFDHDDRRIVTLALFKIFEYGMTHSDSRLHQIYFHDTENTDGHAEEGPELAVEDFPELIVESTDPQEVVEESAESSTGEGANRGIPLLVKICRLITSKL